MVLLLWAILAGVVGLYVFIGLLLYDPGPARLLTASSAPGSAAASWAVSLFPALV